MSLGSMTKCGAAVWRESSGIRKVS